MPNVGKSSAIWPGSAARLAAQVVPLLRETSIKELSDDCDGDM